MLSEASQVVKTRPEVDQVKTIFEATQILPILSGNRDGALLGINSNWLDFSKIEFHYGEDLNWYLASRDQISSLLEKGELPNEKSKETVSSLIQSLIEKAINLMHKTSTWNSKRIFSGFVSESTVYFRRWENFLRN